MLQSSPEGRQHCKKGQKNCLCITTDPHYDTLLALLIWGWCNDNLTQTEKRREEIASFPLRTTMNRTQLQTVSQTASMSEGESTRVTKDSIHLSDWPLEELQCTLYSFLHFLPPTPISCGCYQYNTRDKRPLHIPQLHLSNSHVYTDSCLAYPLFSKPANSLFTIHRAALLARGAVRGRACLDKSTCTCSLHSASIGLQWWMRKASVLRSPGNVLMSADSLLDTRLVTLLFEAMFNTSPHTVAEKYGFGMWT